MNSKKLLSSKATEPDPVNAGFTLVEVIVAILMASIVALAIVVNYVSQTKAYTIQRELAHMQENLRAAMFMLQNDIRNCGRDPQRTSQFGLQSIVRANIDADDPAGYPGLTLTSMNDSDGDGIADPGAAPRTISYQVMDQDGDGRRELRRQDSLDPVIPTPWRLIADGIEDIGFAFAYDDGNGDLARFAGNNTTEIWAIDTNDNNDLDSRVDTNGDGEIDINDAAPQGMPTSVDLPRVRAVRILLLGRSRQGYPDYRDTNTYALGRKVLNMAAPANANRQNFRHLLFTSVVGLQNHELDTAQ